MTSCIVLVASSQTQLDTPPFLNVILTFAENNVADSSFFHSCLKDLILRYTIVSLVSFFAPEFLV